jgi:chromosome segregation ATPase
MQHTSNSPECGESGSAEESRGSDEQLPVSLGSTDSVHYLRERIHIATLEKEMETLEAERDKFARQVEELEDELEQLEDEIDSLEGIIEQKDEQLQQVIANYETVIDHKHDQQMDGQTIEEFESTSRSGIDRVFSWIK